jgi:hypothetical protein
VNVRSWWKGERLEKAAARHAGGVSGGESLAVRTIAVQGLGFAWPVLVQVAAEAV